MFAQSVLSFPRLHLGWQEKALALMVVLSLLLQPIAGMVPPSIALAPARESTAPVADVVTTDVSTPLTPPALAAPVAPAYPLPAELGGNRYAILQDALPLHYQDATGGWQPIDPAFVRIAGGWLNNTNTIRTALAERTSAARIGLNRVGVGWQPAALEIVDSDGAAQTVAQPDPAGVPLPAQSSDGRTVRYTASWSEPGLQDQWQSGPGLVAYSMRLPALPESCQLQGAGCEAEQLDLRILLRLAPGTTIKIDGKPLSLAHNSQLATRNSQLATRNSLIFTSASGEELILNPPFSYEQGRRDQAVAGEYVISATAEPDVIELRVRTPWAWLAAPERQFPVIIDPLFQVRNETQRGTAHYDRSTLAHKFNEDIGWWGSHSMGSHLQRALRLLLRFELPRMPAGTTINKAFLLAAPNGIGNYVDEYAPIPSLTADVSVYAIQETPGHWWEHQNAEPVFDPNAPMPPGPQRMSFSKGQQQPAYSRWDVTSAAQSWNRTTLFDPVNMGLILRAANEQCVSPLAGTIIMPDCGAYQFDQLEDNRTNDELVATQYLSNQDEPFLGQNPSTRGVRLIVYYSGPQLQENAVVGGDLPGGLVIPAGDHSPYYGADHLYTVPQLPNNRWQAVVSRSFTETVGPDPSTCQQPCNQRTPLQGFLPMKVEINDSKSGAQLLNRNLQSVLLSNGEAGYILFNGRGAPTEYTDTPLNLRVSSGTGTGNVTGYDVRLISEQPAPIAAQTGTRQDFHYTLDSGDPLALWNLQMAPGTVNRIRISIVTDGTRPNSYTNLYANRLRAQVVRSNSQQAMPVSTGGAGTVKQWPLAKDPTSSGMITAGAEHYALAIANHGPRLSVYDEEECGKEFCNFTVVPIKYTLKIEITSCAAGTFPTQAGECQKVECPNTQNFAANTTHYEEIGGMRVWSKSGWTRNGGVGDSVAGDSAPLVGPAGSNSPTVAILGGKIHYEQANVIQVDDKSTVMLIQCPATYGADGAYQKWFDVYDGAMERQTILGLPPTPILRAVPVLRQRMVQMPWDANDQSELNQLDFTVNPNANGASRATGGAQLRRTLDNHAGGVVLLRFLTGWSWTVDGWPSLSSTVSAADDNPFPPDLASLIVRLGASFSLDTEPPRGEDQRRFLAVRAHNATVTQQAKLGGASRSLQAVILPRNVPIPEINRVCPNKSCLDLRAPNDQANLPAPRRNWEMPSVLTNVGANTVMMSAAGNLTVYSSDHPNVGTAAVNDAFSKEFSFGANKAKVSVDFAPCGGVGPDVFIIRGEAEVAVPNVGAGVASSFMLCETSLRSVHMSFEAAIGVPLGNSGLFLTGMHGGVDIFPDYTKITVGLNFQAAPGGNGGVFKATGTVIIDTRGLVEFQGAGKVLGTVDASGKIWVAWNPLDTGFEVNVAVGKWLKGFARAHLWQGQGWQNRYQWLPDNDDMHFAGQIGATLIIPEGIILDWGPVMLPPGDISIGVEVAFGEFCVNSSCTVYEWGIKGKFIVLGYDVGLYYGFDKGLDFILGNDDHILIDQFGGLTAAGVAAANLAQVQAAPERVNGETLIPLTVKPSAEQIMVALGWQAGAPALSLIDPDGVEINAANAAQHGAQAGGNASTAILTVQMPKAGTWQARISNLSEQGVEHYKFIYLANKGAPGTPGNRGQFLNPVAAAEPGTNSYLVRWDAPEDTPETATISLYYYRTEVISGNLQLGAPIVKNLPFSAGQFQWDTSGLPNGQYFIRAEVDDGVNELPLDQISNPDNACLPANGDLPAARAFDPNRFPGTEVFTSTGTIAVNDLMPPLAPAGLQIYPVDNAIMLRWNAAPEPDVNSYLVRWGARRPDALPQGFIIQNQALVAAKDASTGAPWARIGAVTNGIQYGVDIAALDVNGNLSPFAPASFGTPDAGGNVIPAAPISLTLAVRTAESATFNWDAGAGVAPASYRVESIKLGDTVVIAHQESATNSIALSGLETGASYLVRVAAGNSDGWYSDYSAPVQVLVTNGVDANGDGMADDWAAQYGVTDPNGDPDGDGLTSAAEYQQGSHPLKQDSDGDGFSDLEEQLAESNPQDALSFGADLLQPRLHLSEDRLTFKAKKQEGGAATPQAVHWLNSGGGVLNLQAMPDQPWISAGVNGDAIQVSVDHSSLAPGFYSGVVRLSNGAGGQPIIGGGACVRVNVWVAMADTDTPSVLERQLLLPLISSQ
jgi:hypothetical protein